MRTEAGIKQQWVCAMGVLGPDDFFTFSDYPHKGLAYIYHAKKERK